MPNIEKGKSLEEILDAIKTKGHNVQQIARLTSIPATRIYKWLDGKGSPDYQDGLKLTHWAKDNLEKIPKKRYERGDDKQEVEDPGARHEHMTIQALTDEIVASNRELSTAAKDNAESIKIIANSNAELVQLLKKKSSAGVDGETSVDAAARFADLLELIADIASGKRFRSKQEALAELNKFVPLPQADK